MRDQRSAALERLSAFIRDRRKNRNLTQDNMAKALGMSRSGYSSLETGRTEPNLEQLRLIAKALRIDPRKLMDAYCSVERHEIDGEKHEDHRTNQHRQALIRKVRLLPAACVRNTERIVDLLIERDRSA